MSRTGAWIVQGASVLGFAVLCAALTVWGLSEQRLQRQHPLPAIEPVALPIDDASIARGAHLAGAVANCAECHDDDLGGRVFMDAGPVGFAAGPNLTRGAGGLGGTFSVTDWVRAIRYGVRADGTSLLVMPSETFVHLTDTDLGALIAYLRRLPPIDRDVPRTRLGPIGRVLLVMGRMNLLVAEKTPRLERRPTPRAGATAEYGEYLANVSGCRGCHGLNLSGGPVAGPPGTPPTSNLTPTGLGSWTEADFVRALREGTKPDGTSIDEFMPWKLFARMTDDELRAIWLYLRMVPPMETGNR